MVERDHALQFGETVGDLLQLRREERLPCGQYFEVGRRAVLHQQLGALDGTTERCDLLVVERCRLACRLAGGQRIVDLLSGIENRLLVGEHRLLLLRFGDLHARTVGAGLEDRLQQLSCGRQKQLAGVDDLRPCAVRPTGRTAERNLRIERRTCFGRSIIGRHERVLGAAYVGTAREQLHGDADEQVGGHLLAFERAALDLVRSLRQQRT